MAIADKIRLLVPFSVERKIGEENFKFYQVKVRVAAKMSGFLSRMAGHVATLLTDGKQDVGTQIEDFNDPESGAVVTKTTQNPINPDLAELRTAQRKAGVEGAISELMSKGSRKAIAELLCNSLRDEFPDKNPSDADLAFFDDLEIPVYIQFIRGLFEANQNIVGDLGKGLGRAVQERAEEMLGQISPEKTETDG